VLNPEKRCHNIMTHVFNQKFPCGTAILAGGPCGPAVFSQTPTLIASAPRVHRA